MLGCTQRTNIEKAASFGRGGRGAPGRNSPMDILQNCERAADRKTESRAIPGSIKPLTTRTAQNDAEPR